MRPILIFDGDCGICTRLADLTTARLRRRPEDFDVTAWQHLELDEYPVTAEQCDAAAQWVDARGRVWSGQDAVAQTLIAGRPGLRLAGRLILLPGVNRLAGVVYRWVAANRHRLPGGTPVCSMPADRRPSAES